MGRGPRHSLLQGRDKGTAGLVTRKRWRAVAVPRVTGTRVHMHTQACTHQTWIYTHPHGDRYTHTRRCAHTHTPGLWCPWAADYPSSGPATLWGAPGKGRATPALPWPSGHPLTSTEPGLWSVGRDADSSSAQCTTQAAGLSCRGQPGQPGLPGSLGAPVRARALLPLWATHGLRLGAGGDRVPGPPATQHNGHRADRHSS